MQNNRITTETIQRLSNNQIYLQTLVRENTAPPNFPGTGQLLGGRFNVDQIVTEMRQRLNEQYNQHLQGSTDIRIPRIRDIAGTETLDYLNIDSLNNEVLTSRVNFISSILNQEQILLLQENGRLNNLINLDSLNSNNLTL